MIIETHCHSHHSFDCFTSINSILSTCKKNKVNAVIITDHDCFGLTEEETSKFQHHNITLIEGIEFTTTEGLHIIGVSKNIKTIEKPAYSYSTQTLISSLLQINATIIIPHPSHETGLLGNKVVSQKAQQSTIKNAHFFEGFSYKYGKVLSHHRSIIKHHNQHIKEIIGSDAHTPTEIGSCVNHISITHDTSIDIIQQLKNTPITFIQNKKRSSLYFQIKALKKKNPYQLLIKYTSSKLRSTIKKIIYTLIFSKNQK